MFDKQPIPTLAFSAARYFTWMLEVTRRQVKRISPWTSSLLEYALAQIYYFWKKCILWALNPYKGKNQQILLLTISLLVFTCLRKRSFVICNLKTTNEFSHCWLLCKWSDIPPSSTLAFVSWYDPHLILHKRIKVVLRSSIPNKNSNLSLGHMLSDMFHTNR
jgi:hypothetical protein